MQVARRAAEHCKALAVELNEVREGLAFKAHRLVYNSTLGSRVIKKKKKQGAGRGAQRGEGDSRPGE